MNERKSDTDILKDLKAYQASLVEIKKPYEPVMDELIKFANHTRRQITDTSKGTVTGAGVFDGTANGANRIQADGFFGNLCSQSLRWFEEALPVKFAFPRASNNMRKWSGKRLDDIPEVKAWLEACDDVLYAAFLRSNFYDEQPVFYRDGGSVGCANKYVEEDVKKGRLVFTTLHPREYVVAFDAWGNCDTEFRTWKLSLKQLVDKFGKDALKEDIPNLDQAWEKNPYEEREITHAVLPREDFDPSKRDNKNKPFASFWYFPGGKKILLESGYEHFPFIHWQFNKGNYGYGYGPGHEAYVDIMLANQQEQSNLVAGQKMVEPPMVVHNNLRGLVNVGPKGRTYVQNMEFQPRPLMEDIKLPYALEMLDRTRKIIRERWNVDFFLMLSQLAFENQKITATQVMEMMGEKATMLGTVVGRIANDELNPDIDLVFYAEQEAGRIPPMPQIMLDSGLTNANIEIDYTGPLAQAQKRAHATQGIRQGLAAVGEVVQIFPQARHKIKIGDAVDKLLLSLGFPASCLASEDEFNAAVEAETKKSEQAASMEQITQIGQALPGMGKAIEPNSPAEALVEGMGGKLKGQEATE